MDLDRPGEAPAYAGTDFIIARDGRIAAVYLFFDQLPELSKRSSSEEKRFLTSRGVASFAGWDSTSRILSRVATGLR